MDELKRPGVVGGEIRAVTNAQHGRILQLTVERAHDTALAVFVERRCGFVEKDPAWFVQEESREGEALLLAERELIAQRSTWSSLVMRWPRSQRSSARRTSASGKASEGLG
jgi:hypothetical protein